MIESLGTEVSMRSVALQAFMNEVEKKKEAKKAAKARKKELRQGDDDEMDGAKILKGCGCLVVGITLLSVMSTGPMYALGVPGAVVGFFLLRRWLRRSREEREIFRGVAAFEAGETHAVQTVCRFAMKRFQQQIEVHRARTLGRDSDWGIARESLARAADEAQRSRAYWRTRLQQEPDNSLAVRQHDTASELDRKLHAALDKLDGRASVLREFYHDCEAKVAAMGQYNRDIEETRRLTRLTDTADTMIVDAEATLASIGASFVLEAQQVGAVLGDFEKLQIKSLAGDAPVDDIEFLADRIIDASDREYEAVEQLDRVVKDMYRDMDPVPLR